MTAFFDDVFTYHDIVPKGSFVYWQVILVVLSVNTCLYVLGAADLSGEALGFQNRLLCIKVLLADHKLGSVKNNYFFT
ncbi:MAG: hypothetical protein FWH37_00135 [Candidatus Bathyarchaeota archaeon]|nr:hypothetical protein [Candidatus Termiticorpusculum sp.]